MLFKYSRNIKNRVILSHVIRRFDCTYFLNMFMFVELFRVVCNLLVGPYRFFCSGNVLGNHCIGFLRRQYQRNLPPGVQNLATRVEVCSCALGMTVLVHIPGYRKQQVTQLFIFYFV